METRETFMTSDSVGRPRSTRPMSSGSRAHAEILAASGLLVATFLVLAGPVGPVRGLTVSGYGAGVFVVNGASNATISLAEGGVYYLGVATDVASNYVDARLTYNQSLAAELNGSGSAASFVSLSAGNYSIVLEGHGRAALGWDFTDGSVQNFPDNETVTAFLRPSSPRLQIIVSLGNAQEIHLDVYDDRLLSVAATNVTASGAVSFELPASHASAAYLVASVVAGNPQGVFGLAWSSPSPAAPGTDIGSQILVAVLWIGVPVAIVLLLYLALGRRRGGTR